ncbi:hypothetical protein EMIHUDRAFT_351167 [Emiliania huxleyi CCMP1516]|uniref:Vacuolar protein sorting 55 n=2 Tax=Emiliania huxleyi TaxID=2903 RepID=A0A0D3KZD5_EMIH1|nr:hypothetical protein EMIHUDRAFT_421436 [Emiliania huxleyi CCMP1516]XP_005793549.1 hypothetical protein EMIHUDRAFT_351167 [Emiliania huxleyi CCMP1516]EOD24520.1 hypothetical protein EMIHUDRAFT_421436 [Emiliania huxleyi CCMP1516]EOD41120.1 hypothetical protein EMIHUDRAFT_351167 [Emiliania huxleyi CCMP1516]|eukprot:XP_005776949.1 hypothetical protein EMIHUDRAFT_421436 [Emiliania huxleyi CCMP1516]
MSNLVGLLVPAGLLSLAIFMHILACAMYNNWWPLMSLLLYALMLLPLAALARQSESLFDSAPTGFHWAIFLLASLVTLVIGVPIVMWHVDVIESGSVFFNLSGFVLLLATGASAALFGEKQSDGWG